MANATRATDLNEFFNDLDAGIVQQMLEQALSDVALAVVSTGKKGHISLSFNVSQIKTFDQVAIKHEITVKKPTSRGSQTEQDLNETAMYVHRGGILKFYPADQGQLFKEKETK